LKITDEIPAWLNIGSLTELTTIERSFQSINTGLNWMGKPQAVHVTPRERAMLVELIPAPPSKILLREHQAAFYPEWRQHISPPRSDTSNHNLRIKPSSLDKGQHKSCFCKAEEGVHTLGLKLTPLQ
jgi:hypothetical protein